MEESYYDEGGKKMIVLEQMKIEDTFYYNVTYLWFFDVIFSLFTNFFLDYTETDDTWTW